MRQGPEIAAGYEFVRYRPWRGPDYESGSMLGMRVLIVGESHYREPARPESESLTVDVCEDWLESPDPHFQIPIIAAITGNANPSSDECRRLWRSIAFYNYVRHPMPDAGTRPKDDEFDHTALDAFREVLKRLRPACVLLFSMNVYNYMPCDYDRSDPAAAEALDWHSTGGRPMRGMNGAQLGWFDTNEGEQAFLLPMSHPNRWKYDGTAPVDWHPFIRKAVDYARARTFDAGA